VHGGSCVTDVIKLAVPLRVSINFDVETEVKLVWETKQSSQKKVLVARALLWLRDWTVSLTHGWHPSDSEMDLAAFSGWKGDPTLGSWTRTQ